ncbi:MAG: glycosyltransferase family 4 protein [Bacteroidota bacterium]|nr:glycosyltransferase family 4 protein [Bacteroidota bacterium]
MKIGFFSGRAWESWDATSPLKTGIGGSETCLVYLSKELARFGHDVSLFIDTDKSSVVDNVKYYPFPDIKESKEEFDFFIHFRTIQALEFAKSNVHIGFAQDTTLPTPDDKKDLSNGKLNYLFSLSKAHTDYLSEQHNFPIEKIRMTANGVDPKRYDKKVDKIRNTIFYSSCPSRDLDRLLWLSQDIAKYVPNFKLIVAYGMQTWEGLLRQGRGDYKKHFGTTDMMKNFPWVKYIGRQNQNDLADLQMASRGWFYPTSFPETFCITAVEAGFARCPILTSNCFGLETTVGSSGIIIKEEPEFGEKFIAHAIRLLTDEPYWREWSEKAHSGMKKYTWENVALQWDEFFKTNNWEDIQ